MDLSAFISLTPQLIIASGVVLAMLLVAWQRSQKMIAYFTTLILLMAIIATVNAMGGEKTFITTLLAVDDYSRYAFILVLVSSLCCVYLSTLTLCQGVEVHDEYYLLLLLVVLGAGILIVSEHFASLFLGFEILSIALVGLVGYFRQSQFSVETGFKYLILSASASSFMLLGIAFIYAQTGDLSFSHAVIEQTNITLYASLSQSVLYQLGFILFFAGIAFKLSLVPFHYWTPDVYQGASTPVTLLLATVSKCAMFIVLLKCCFTASHFSLIQGSNVFSFIAWLAILSMIVGNCLALKQQKIKRLLGYSSIAHMGYLLIVVLLGNLAGIDFAWQSVLFYLSAYLLANVSIFTVLTFDDKLAKGDAVTIDSWQGLFWRQPLLATLVIFSVLSFAGIPLTAGFIGKFYLVSFAADHALWSLLAALIVGSGIALAYYLPIIFALFCEPQSTPEENVQREITLADKSVVSLYIALGFVLGIYPDVIGKLLQQL